MFIFLQFVLLGYCFIGLKKKPFYKFLKSVHAFTTKHKLLLSFFQDVNQILLKAYKDKLVDEIPKIVLALCSFVLAKLLQRVSILINRYTLSFLKAFLKLV